MSVYRLLARFRRAMTRTNDSGLNMPEMLIIIALTVLVGAWALTNLLPTRSKGVDGGVRSDLSAMAIAQETYITDNPAERGLGYANGTFAALPSSAQGSAPQFNKTAGNIIVVGVTPANAAPSVRGYCIAGWNPNASRQGAASGEGAGKFWYDSALGGMQPGPDRPTGGACAAVTTMPTA